MSPKDPLLTTLKGCILSLKSDEGTVTDANPHLSPCCQLLELILRKGLQQPALGLMHRDYWHCVEQLPGLDTCGRLSPISLALEQTSACKKLLTAQGRGRYFLRLALKRRIMGSVVQHLSHTAKLLEWYNPGISILRNEESVEPFLSLMLVLSEMEFKLDIENCSFLDESWILPVCEVYEVVPCRELGIVLRYLDGRVFVLDLLEGSQAQVDRCVLPGDIIDEINGISLRNASNGQAGTVLARLKGSPLSLRVLRPRGVDGSAYQPVLRFLQQLQRENPSLKLGSHLTSQQEDQDHSQCLKDGRILYLVQFLGKANIGLYGGKEVLQQAIPHVLEKNQPTKTALLDLKETHLTCMEKSTKQELFQHHYTEISCVGRHNLSEHALFAFCVLDRAVSPPKTFCCVVLQASSIQECEEIVSRIAIGFKHTEWFV